MATADPNRLFERAHEAFAAGRLSEAESLLKSTERLVGPHPAVLHLRALTAKRLGDRRASRNWFEEALRADPKDPDILSNYGNLLMECGDLEAALVAYGQALDARPGFSEARLNRAAAFQKLGRDKEALSDLDEALRAAPGSPRAYSMRGSSLLSLGRLDEAGQAFDAALQRDPGRGTALVGRATVALRRGEELAVPLLEEAAAARPGDAAVMLKLAEAMEAAGDPRALPTLENAIEALPSWAEGQATLARMRWEAGEGTGFTRSLTRALARMPHEAALWTTLAGALGAADMHVDAADAAARGQLALGGSPELALLEALNASEAADFERADAAFARVPPGLAGARTIEARHRLRTQDLERAQVLLTDELAERPWDITAWSLQGLLWRLGCDERCDWLHGQTGLVSEQALDLDAQQIGGLAEFLRSLHRVRTHPIGQSLRGGTQTRGCLLERTEIEIRLLHDAIQAAVERHWNALPRRDDRHPLLRWREQRPRIGGSWSVRLIGGGFHVAHIHPQGVLSSAAYLVVPASTGTGEGWLEIGRPPPELGLELDPLQAFEPKPGKLVLFPSTMFHGTRRFNTGERLTMAFDVLAG